MEHGHDDFYKKILDNNKIWSETKLANDPQYFQKLVAGQSPPLLWIGCSDSRVPANEVIGAMPGEVFVHRNIANMVVHSDMNMLSVLDYAVNVLKVQHVIVSGHYGCGGVKAAMGNSSIGIIDNWIRHIKDVYRHNHEYLNAIEDFNERFDAFVEINVKEQVYDLAKTSIVQTAWKRGQQLCIHGWVYGLGDGIVKDLGVNFCDNNDLGEVDRLIFQ
ncbi:carbonate dehydratase [Flavobacterium subsaxonicum]|uniref:Carbonic anhydrase 2 n=1 Tax=Flavobacterium subsaxonicum WB 4.1-42 = DSM 21790 TaxID=1121898 RepID=A0A0A2MK87_9FLAO|nr:carbonate dehydratase [Flavobacterium subsaxonicum]KGO93057.1 carbonate dehydratase [Flavobacterium subsaxonicum WB 4.1-42 = DSM 21790]